MENHTSQEAYDTIGKYRCFPPFNSPANHKHQIKPAFFLTFFLGLRLAKYLRIFGYSLHPGSAIYPFSLSKVPRY